MHTYKNKNNNSGKGPFCKKRRDTELLKSALASIVDPPIKMISNARKENAMLILC